MTRDDSTDRAVNADAERMTGARWSRGTMVNLTSAAIVAVCVIVGTVLSLVALTR